MVYTTYFLLHDDKGGLYDDALRDLLQLVRDLEKSSIGAKDTTWIAAFLNGEIDRRKKNFDVAEEEFNRSIKENRSSALPWLALAQTQLENNDEKNGFASLEVAGYLILKSVPDGFQHLGFEQVGVAYEHVGRYTEAIKFYIAAVKKKPDWASGRETLAQAYLNVNQPDKALPELQKAISLDPKEAIHYYFLGEAQRKLEHPEVAFQSFKKAVELDPGNPLYHYALGLEYESKGEKDAAWSSYSAALNIAEKNKEFSKFVSDLQEAIKRVEQ
jgi:tetratricopeptide (TPR) repeat protein